MAKTFDVSGISFQYPDDWSLEQEDTEAGWTASLYSPDTAFMLLSLREDCDDPAQLADETLGALREDYPDLESESCIDTLAGQPAVGHEIHFFSLDLTATCRTRCVLGPTGALLVLCQSGDLDLEAHEPIFDAVCKSIRFEDLD
jgi:hypothetical protein